MSQSRSNGQASQGTHDNFTRPEDGQGEVRTRPQATAYRMKPGGNARYSAHAGEQFENPTEVILQLLEARGCQPRPTLHGDRWMALCPVHANDGLHKDPNLQIQVGNDNDCVLTCFAHACDDKAIMAALGLQEWHLFRPRPDDSTGSRNGHTNGQTNGKPQQEKDRTYPSSMDVLKMLRRKYGRDEEKNYKYSDDYVVSRFVLPGKGKQMMPISRGSNGLWGNCGPEGILPLFNLRAIQELPPGSTVWVVEGEKCVQILGGLGIPAVTSAQGNRSAHKSDWSPLMGYKVVLNPDNDQAGEDYVKAVAGILWAFPTPPEIRLIRFSHLPPGGDIEQHMANCEGFDHVAIREDLETMAAAADIMKPPPKKSKYPIRTFADVAKSIGELVHFWENWLICGNLNMIFSLPKVGKSRFYLALAKMAWFGAPWPDGAPNPWPPGRKTIIVPYDNNHSEIYKELKRWGVPDEAAICPSDPADEKGITILDLQSPLMTEVLEDICEHEPDVKFLVVDTLTYASTKNLCKPEEVKALLDPIMRLAAKYNLCPLVLVHESGGGKAYGLRVGERARIHLRMERYDENDWKKVRLYVSESNFPERPALTMFHEEGSVRFGRDEGPVVKTGEKRGCHGTKSRDFGNWIKKQLEGGPVRVMELINLARMDGFMKAPTDEDPEPSISPLYNAMRMLVRQGTNIEEFKEPRERGKPLTWWRLVDHDVAHEPHQEDVADPNPYAPY